MMMTPTTPIDDAELAARVRDAADLLEAIGENRGVLARVSTEDRQRLLNAVGLVFSPDINARRRLRKEAIKRQKASVVRREERVLSNTGSRKLRRETVFTTPNICPPEEVADEHDTADANERHVSDSTHCYVCKVHYTAIDHFYDQLCPECARYNFAKRTELADLRGRVALLTGGRVKIGYQAGLKLLRSGAHLIVTTRFPRNAATRYAEETDFGEWAHRLEIVGLDLRHVPGVEAFCRDLVSTRPRLDFIINNACQTVRRPPDFYAHMMAAETAALREMPAHVRALLDTGNADQPAELAMIPLLPEELLLRPDLFPSGQLDADLQQIDLRRANSWRMLLADVPTVEMLEVQIVNAIAPFLLNARLKTLMLRVPGRDKHIVNVSAVEGQFYRIAKTTRHPHTNMAKAALNMMTRTAATDYYNDGIHMNSVDTGWITDEDPAELAARKVIDQRFHPPLDAVDGVERWMEPLIDDFSRGKLRRVFVGDPPGVDAVHVDSVVVIVGRRRARHHVERGLRHVRVRMPRRLGDPVELPLDRRHIDDVLVASGHAEHERLQTRIQEEGRDGVDDLHLEHLHGRHVCQQHPPRVRAAQIDLLKVRVQLARRKQIRTQKQFLRQERNHGEFRGLIRIARVEKRAYVRRHLAQGRGLGGHHVRVKIWWPADSLAGVVDDEVEARASGHEIAAEGLHARHMPEVEADDLEPVCPLAEIGLFRVARGRIAREPRRDDEMRAGAEQFQPRLIANLDAAARQQCDASTQVRQFCARGEVLVAARGAELIVEHVHARILLLADVT